MPQSISSGANITAATGAGDVTVTCIKDYITKGEKSDASSQSMTIEAKNCNISFTAEASKITIDKE